MRLNISVPDDLAKEARRLNIAISAICQGALRWEVHRLRQIEIQEAANGEQLAQAVAQAAEAAGAHVGPEAAESIAREVSRLLRPLTVDDVERAGLA